MVNYTERRQVLRSILSGSACESPASVHDPLSARIAEKAGFKFGLLSGSVVAATTLAAPDLLVHTLNEFADQIRRISRASQISILADADNGFGNALNVMRTVEEFEHAGVSGLSIEDTAVFSFGMREGKEQLVSVDEMAGKLRAALAARKDPSLVIAARTKAIAQEGLEGAVARIRAYTAAGVDAIWLVTIDSLEQLHAVRAATHLPLIIGTNHGALTRDQLAAAGARIMLQGHLPIAATVRALANCYRRLAGGEEPSALKDIVASPSEMDAWVGLEEYKSIINKYM